MQDRTEEHPAGCVYGGFSAYTAYWLSDPACALPHPTPVPLNRRCMVCNAPSGELHDTEDALHRAFLTPV